MCWIAVDRGIVIAGRVEQWQAIRSEIGDAILARGWNPDISSFTQGYADVPSTPPRSSSRTVACCRWTTHGSPRRSAPCRAG